MENITFFAWGDTHFGYEPKSFDEDLRGDIIRQFNGLPGWPLPPCFQGNVAEPDFVVLCGDSVDGEEGDAEREFSYFRYFLNKLKFPHYEVIGNHDETEPFMNYYLDKYGSRSYSFDCKGVHFISLSTEYDEAEQGMVPAVELDWLKKNLAKIKPSQKIVLFMHTAISALKNPSQLIEVLDGSNIVLAVNAHLHKTSVSVYKNINCLSIGHCRNHPIDAEADRNFYVVTITENRIIALPWRWDLNEWEDGRRWTDKNTATQRYYLDVTL